MIHTYGILYTCSVQSYQNSLIKHEAHTHTHNEQDQNVTSYQSYAFLQRNWVQVMMIINLQSSTVSIAVQGTLKI